MKAINGINVDPVSPASSGGIAVDLASTAEVTGILPVANLPPLVGASNELRRAGKATTGLANGDLGYESSPNVMTKTDAAVDASSRVYGANEGTAGEMTIGGEIEAAKFTTVGGQPTNGAPVFLSRGDAEASAAGKLSAVIPASGFVAEVGTCMDNASYAAAKTCRVLYQPKAVIRRA